jgi:hypothetical protein
MSAARGSSMPSNIRIQLTALRAAADTFGSADFRE